MFETPRSELLRTPLGRSSQNSSSTTVVDSDVLWHHALFNGGTRGGPKMPRTVARTMVRSWSGELDALSVRIAPRLARSEVRKRAQAYLRGLLASVRSEERRVGKECR